MDNPYRRKNRIYGVIIVTFVLVLLVMLWQAGRRDDLLSTGEQIAVLPLQGEIMDSHEWVKQLERFVESRRIVGVLVPVNSPGGAVAPSQEIYDALKRAREKYDKPIVASLGSVAASGGYYAALGADSIISNPGTLTGSIGVIMQFPVYSELMEKIGVSMKVIKSEDFKDAGSPYREMNEVERQYFQEIIDDVYDQFVTIVEEERGLDRQTLLPLAQGQVFSGRQAFRYGLVDGIGSFTDARELVCDMAGIRYNTPLVYPEKERLSIWNILWDDVTSVIPGSERAAWTTLAYRLPY